jgi:hypothetical protein
MAKSRFASNLQTSSVRSFDQSWLNVANMDKSDPYANRELKAKKRAWGHGITNAENCPALAANADRHAKDYIITNPKGEETQVHNLAKFCRENDLCPQSMGNVARGKRPSHRGWKVRLIEQSPILKMMDALSIPLPTTKGFVGHKDGLVYFDGGRYFLGDVELTKEEGERMVREALGVKEQDGTS